MGREYSQLNDDLQAFIAAQHLFFVATAPLSVEDRINLSPKGLDSFRVLDPKTVAYLDLVGSGIETVAHTRENGRITLLFCAFEGRPRILRLYGRGRAVEREDADWNRYRAEFPEYIGTRSVVVVELESVGDSCGYGVPQYEYLGDRSQLIELANKKGADAMAHYIAQNNRQSLDGLPGMRLGEAE